MKNHVIIIGAQKCGTTTLHKSLIKHSSVNEGIDPISGAPVKEIDFFYKESKWIKGIDLYKSYFKNVEDVSLDSSPNYLFVPECHKRIYDAMPLTKLIICLRNPINRAYSQYNHYVQELPASKGNDWIYKMNFSDNVYYQLKNNKNRKDNFSGLVFKGIYIEQIKLLLQYFQRSQVFITIMEDWETGYASELNKILHFLNLEIEHLPLEIRHKRSYYIDQIEGNVYEALTEFYKPYNELLFEFLGHKIEKWN